MSVRPPETDTNDAPRPVRVALVGDVALEVLAPYFREAGYEVYVPAGFGAWRQELLDDRSALNAFAPDVVFDVTAPATALAAEVPGFYDARFTALASQPYSLAGIRALIDEFAFFRLAAPKKVLAVDADNTLWRGILSEDGAAALVPFAAFQRGLLALRDEGVALVLLSKNDAFEFRADMPLTNGDFAAVRTNWGPKAGNLADACRELNVSLESVVFVDDNPYERAQMAAHLPEVTVVPFPTDLTAPRQFLRRLKTYFFAGMGQTEEDRLRAADYARRRRDGGVFGRGAAPTLEAYLTDLDLRVTPRPAVSGDLPRLEQMAGKTNQFNATTRRRTRGEFAALLADETKRVFVFRTRDRFGEQGIVCYIVVDLPSRRATDFVMSCRAMGRTLEHFAYRHVTERLGFAPRIDFTPTAKNRPFADFLATLDGERKTYYRED
jgi:FkbH-like protein